MEVKRIARVSFLISLFSSVLEFLLAPLSLIFMAEASSFGYLLSFLGEVSFLIGLIALFFHLSKMAQASLLDFIGGLICLLYGLTLMRNLLDLINVLSGRSPQALSAFVFGLNGLIEFIPFLLFIFHLIALGISFNKIKNMSLLLHGFWICALVIILPEIIIRSGVYLNFFLFSSLISLAPTIIWFVYFQGLRKPKKNDDDLDYIL